MKLCIDCGDDCRAKLPCLTLSRGVVGVSICNVCASAYASGESRLGRLRRALDVAVRERPLILERAQASAAH